MIDFKIQGWYGGDFDYSGFYKNKKDAERGISPDKSLHDLLYGYQGKYIKITVKEIKNDK
ncbi:MAG: hypothetical protein ACFFCV_20055 [Promethearchaeota archaeon]